MQKSGVGLGVKLGSEDKIYLSKVVASIINAGISYRDYYISLSNKGISIGYAGSSTGTINYNNIKPYAVFG